MKEGSGGRGWKICLVVTFGLVIAIVLVAVILAMTVYKPKPPIIHVDSIGLKNVEMGVNVFSLTMVVNVTLELDVSVQNPNKFGFRYYGGSATLNYRGQLIGDATIPDGECPAEETKGINVTLTIMADRFVSTPEVLKDIASGILPLNTVMNVSGKVIILGFIKFRVESSSSCDFTVNLSMKKVVDKKCQSKTAF
ncbi:hypothetical protein RJT34_17825 [Clitoria ternatea]|uniref:Late embryogenesis abundant protein LEA-2 subgroup domain-containing protein n=1 Tax=Clitoria ternatea TaxID=43366 RepID=A0AAN9JAZ0_CLITE